MPTRIRTLAIVFSALLFAAPALASDTPPSDAEVDRLLEIMDMDSMMSGMMQQMSDAQQAMVAQMLGPEVSDADRQRASALMASTQARLQERLSWQALLPMVRRVYAQVFSAEEVRAMTEFYASPAGSSILRKSPQAMALTMQEMQPLMMELMQELQADIERELGAPAHSH